MLDRIFIDSNIWIYLFVPEDDKKSEITREYISNNVNNHLFVISHQVINEVCSVLKKKSFTENEIRQVASDMTGLCEVCSNSDDIIFLASEIREMHSFSFWDSLIIANALVADCTLLVSEDMQNGRTIGKLLIKNIFAIS